MASQPANLEPEGTRPDQSWVESGQISRSPAWTVPPASPVVWAQVALFQAVRLEIDATLARIQAQGVPAMGGPGGFRGGLWAVNQEHTQGLNLTFWDDVAVRKGATAGAQALNKTGSQKPGVPQIVINVYDLLACSVTEQACALEPCVALLGTFQCSFPGSLMDEPGRHIGAEALLEQLPGYQGSIWLGDRPSGDMLSITLWASRQDAGAAGEEISRPRQECIMAGLRPGLAPNDVTLFDVYRFQPPKISVGRSE